MRPAAIFVTLLMLFSIAQPLLIQCQAAVEVQVQEEQTTCCKTADSCKQKEAGEKNTNKDCDRTNSCNPFASCSQCPYTAAVKIHQYGPVTELEKTEMFTGLTNESAGFTGDQWNPPEIAYA